MKRGERLLKMFKLLMEKERTKRLIFSVLLFLDVIIIIFSLFIAIQLRFGFIFPKILRQFFWQWALALILLKIILLYLFKLYSFSLRFVGIVEFFRLIKVFFLFMIIATAANLCLLRFYSPNLSLPSGVIIIDSLISFSLFGFVRLIRRLYFEFFRSNSKEGKRTLIVGANIKSERLIKDMRMSKMGMIPIVIADDSSNKTVMRFTACR